MEKTEMGHQGNGFVDGVRAEFTQGLVSCLVAKMDEVDSFRRTHGLTKAQLGALFVEELVQLTVESRDDQSGDLDDELVKARRMMLDTLSLILTSL